MDARQSSLSSLSPLLYPTLPLLTRISYHVILLCFRTFFRVFLALRSILESPIPGTLPTLIKSYPSTPRLKNRIFYPPTYTSSSAPLPLYLSLHGGAFALGDPSLGDTVNAKVCSDWNVHVISLAYPKTPTVRYPGLARAGSIVRRSGPTGPNLGHPRPIEVCASVFGRSSSMICRSGPVSVLDSVWTELCSMR
jgi:hypothetical protein